MIGRTMGALLGRDTAPGVRADARIGGNILSQLIRWPVRLVDNDFDLTGKSWCAVARRRGNGFTTCQKQRTVGRTMGRWETGLDQGASHNMKTTVLLLLIGGAIITRPLFSAEKSFSAETIAQSQKIIDADFAKADEIVVSSVRNAEGEHDTEAHVLLASKLRNEIISVGRQIQILPEKDYWESDDHEKRTLVGYSCRCRGEFEIHLKRAGSEFAAYAIDGALIGGKSLPLSEGALVGKRDALLPFLQRFRDLERQRNSGRKIEKRVRGFDAMEDWLDDYYALADQYRLENHRVDLVRHPDRKDYFDAIDQWQTAEARMQRYLVRYYAEHSPGRLQWHDGDWTLSVFVCNCGEEGSVPTEEFRKVFALRTHALIELEEFWPKWETGEFGADRKEPDAHAAAEFARRTEALHPRFDAWVSSLHASRAPKKPKTDLVTP